ncbi:inositol phospholipid biosynthesis protein, putative [Candida dubliniensis CD36]|uniref:Acyl-coenzyme A diphosphatase SCS3 n=1 Tax=Candida dubliniensis (strain CD36 / ATCC MYA-646 / CBS 7987 / NCPF 3949 / NRRL Y-17841) TaxID=573826 RepID=B9WG72_CANDC|nr:inositol phospholipid biosynthesis protein, putative [Candida dubliniensis CD36]CAX42244.1 inositol phospholipid biosynthesis protein, putative [Candida dubliniensis CD36]
MSTTIYDDHYIKMTKVFKSIHSQTKLKVYEVLFASSFILNFLLGRLIHFSAPDEEVYNYYNDKRNILNQWFVKRGWGWTTLVIILFYSNIIYKQYVNSTTTTKNNKQTLIIKTIRNAIINYIVVTIWWIFFTQWCFGLPIMDKIFVLTGGKCSIDINNTANSFTTTSTTVFTPNHHIHPSFVQKLENIWESTGITSYNCRRIKGSQWIGGHDPSGHVFLMIHSSLYLFNEMINYWPNWSYIKHNISQLLTSTRPLTINDRLLLLWNTPQLIIIGLIGLWWFMLLMTNIYFHSSLEKLVGLIFGYIGVAGLYWIPRWLS